MSSSINAMKTDSTAKVSFVPIRNRDVDCHEPVLIKYFTDPLSPTGFAMEEQLRLLLERNPGRYVVDYHMGGLMPIWDLYHNNGRITHADMAQSWKEAGRTYNLPISGEVWLKDPPNSSYPASIAFKSAQLQDQNKAVELLKRLRTSLFVENNNISKWEHIEKEVEKSGLNMFQFRNDQINVGREKFETDLQLAEQLCVSVFPTFRLSDPCSGQEATLEGYQEAEDIENSLMRVV